MRRATIRSTVADPETIAEALAPDNTDQIETTVDENEVHTTIERETTAGLRSTADDYVMNLSVAIEVAATANRHDTNERSDPTNT
ncbi:KEOPS complex subunit Pcc1 [Halodesulfurarchaeum sp. HSR-GB]|nr:KEOPS complex subunit Pcc1 [Halodesulfurarchaeum sp. HSR-GB]MDR5656986.1 KEOPS complex subunit Pcc1 [Halodesulfurarchaeum sp. HSR-GB]